MMEKENIGQMVDSALLNGIIASERMECGNSLQCESDATRAWCDNCEKVVAVRNDLVKLGYIYRRCKMKYVLVSVSRGIIDEVAFYEDKVTTIQMLSAFAKVMDPERHDAAVYGPDGMILNAKAFLDENEQYVERRVDELVILDQSDEAIFIIGNPGHRLGFMVVSPDNPLGYRNPAQALSDLGQMRKDFGSHLKLFRVQPVNCPVINTKGLQEYNKDCEIEDFDYSLLSEYLK
jgi:hypothetical protein